MLLHQDSILKLEYDPATDILEMTWPDIDPDLLPEVRQAMQTMVETIRNYDVKKVLIDGSKASITISKEESTSLSLKLAQDLNSTRLQKIARLESTDLRRESEAEETRLRIQTSLDLHYEMQNFADRSSALAWLK
ncbi:hypothetical protein [Sabulibacter ruber]|uniref:hypothetical protein n=1 Tax=Sabulibacter ruber TaxID=2811901 RepID=UPI001A979898|nr:hypothetical protein [Sabulibacter ruber]